MPNIVFDITSDTPLGTTSSTVDLIGHFTLSIASLGTADYSGNVALESYINGNWIVSQEFEESGIFPGFNPMHSTYRLRVTQTITENEAAQVVLNGYTSIDNKSF